MLLKKIQEPSFYFLSQNSYCNWNSSCIRRKFACAHICLFTIIHYISVWIINLVEIINPMVIPVHLHVYVCRWNWSNKHLISGLVYCFRECIPTIYLNISQAYVHLLFHLMIHVHAIKEIIVDKKFCSVCHKLLFSCCL